MIDTGWKSCYGDGYAMGFISDIVRNLFKTSNYCPPMSLLESDKIPNYFRF